jgi:hypothetical protein
MARFERPANTINDASDLKIGDHVWHVFGIWPPCMYETIVIGEAKPYKKHRKYSDIHSQDAEKVVFDVRYPDIGREDMKFAADGNLVSGYSHNDNYWFRNEADARAAVEMLAGVTVMTVLDFIVERRKCDERE